MNVRLYNAQILTMENGMDIFSGEIWIKNDKIVHIATEEEITTQWRGDDVPRFSWDIQVNCEGNLLMPGFKNAHTHSGMTLFRSVAEDLPLEQWLNEIVFPTEEKLSEEDIYSLSKLAILEYLASGITSVADMYLAPDAMANACLDMGMRCVLISGLNNFTFSIEQVEEQYLKWNKKKSLISYQLGCHAEYTCSRELLVRLANLAHRHRAPVYLHMSETAKEVKECKERYGMTPAMFLDSLGMFQYGGGGYHCVHMTDEDMEVFRRHRMYVISNPCSNAKLASGVAPIKDFMNKHIPVALGTDGAGSNNSLDMFKEMFMVAGLSNLREMDAASLSAFDVLQMATTNSARAMGLNKCDVLAKGKKADIIMLDLNMPNMKPMQNVVNHIVYSGNKSNVKMTMINGKIVYYNGGYNIGESPEDIYKKCEEIKERVLKNS